MKLKNRLLIIPLITITLALLVLEIITINTSEIIAVEQLTLSQNNLVEGISYIVNGYIDEHSKLLTLLREQEHIKDTSEYKNIETKYKGLSDLEGLEIRNIFKKTRQVYPTFAYLEVFTKEGVNVVLEPYAAQLNISERII